MNSKSAKPKVAKLINLSIEQYQTLEKIKLNHGWSHNRVILRGIDLAIQEIAPKLNALGVGIEA